MKRLLTLSVGTTMLVFGVTAPALAQAQPGDSLTGEARDCVQILSNGLCESRSVRIDAHSGPSGENPSGTVRYEFSLGTPSSSGSGEGTVTCLSVTGNVAIVGFTGREFSFFGPFVAGLVAVVDRGGPDSGLDRFGYFLEYDISAPLPGPTDCAVPTGGLSWVNDEGDLTVVDAPAVPSAKAQCKNGGWRNFPGFKNQGDCVSFVATGGKNPPGSKTG